MNIKLTILRSGSVGIASLALLLGVASIGAGCAAQVTEGESGEGTDEGALEGEELEGEEAEPACEIGESRSCTVNGTQGFEQCENIDDVATWTGCQAGGGAASTPLVLSFEERPVEYVTAMSGAFDLSGLGATIATDWPTAATPWLALDRDGNGAIDGGEELFGSATVLSSGARADNGFTALRELDTDGDGRITARDEAWSRLVLWSDRDANRASSAGELEPLASRGLVAIELSYGRDRRCDARGNCEIERASFTFSEGASTRTGAVVDVHLRWQ
ncbi:putative hemolysin-type calcium binding protein [Sorangium cellulosum So ce56]|uniref:Hemolysin-type calcium binding protein n=1 Tax=Sorangium cellulosum (strain So ce56) TaxID=448385 RepID=A9FJG6_SORC5|nr:hemolysin-type calcium-binding protein [Sorangium cellulosum]CAN91961.1 putative hemolysin-type calcium binding protein [Sorangium cellulosum So ce56]